ncbi:LOW QUALITY PROTEIN: hypothetical protein QYF61_013403 [Mycteria americana]|uniref:Uncharacterized protein n=1 Tax=Mycteria americana TaxID=33587 RepID=A0AAN7MI39_MYCAM|nr:LOW QUALITY PROTEIN: hypothetical protein QYF61_013403 [Mycteria americana]
MGHVPTLWATCAVLKSHNKFSAEPSLLQAEQPQLSQPFLIGEVFQPSDHFCGPPLDQLQQLHVFPVLRAPELDAVLQLLSHSCECTLLSRVQPFIHQYPQVLLCRAALDHIIPQPVLELRIAPTQDLALGLVELHEVHTGPLLQLVQVPLDDIPSFWCVNCTTQLGVICKLAEGALNPTVYVVDEDIGQHWSQYRPLRDPTLCESCSSGGYTFFDLPFLVDIPVEALLVILCVPCQVQLQPPLGLPDPIPTQAGSVPILFPGLDSSMLVSSLPCLISYTWGLRALALYGKIFQLCSAPLSLRAVSQGFLLTNSLKSWKFAFLKFRVLTLLFACPISLRTVNST